jgi:hypothetical protein
MLYVCVHCRPGGPVSHSRSTPFVHTLLCTHTAYKTSLHYYDIVLSAQARIACFTNFNILTLHVFPMSWML